MDHSKIKICCDAKLFVAFEFYLKKWMESINHKISKHKRFGILIKEVQKTNQFEHSFRISNYNLEKIHRVRNAYIHSLGEKKARLDQSDRTKIIYFINWCHEKLDSPKK